MGGTTEYEGVNTGERDKGEKEMMMGGRQLEEDEASSRVEVEVGSGSRGGVEADAQALDDGSAAGGPRGRCTIT